MIQWHFKTFQEFSLEELYKIIQLRIEVFVIEQNAPYQDCDGIDLECYHLYGMIEEEVVAYARCIPSNISYVEPSIGRIVTAKKVRGTGAGRNLVTLGLEAMKTQFKTSRCRISAQTYLKVFYESFGFTQVSEVYLEDGLPHVEMVR